MIFHINSYLFCFKFKENPKYELRIFGMLVFERDIGSCRIIFGFGDKLNAFVPLSNTLTNTNITDNVQSIEVTGVFWLFRNILSLFFVRSVEIQIKMIDERFVEFETFRNIFHWLSKCYCHTLNPLQVNLILHPAKKYRQ